MMDYLVTVHSTPRRRFWRRRRCRCFPWSSSVSVLLVDDGIVPASVRIVAGSGRTIGWFCPLALQVSTNSCQMLVKTLAYSNAEWVFYFCFFSHECLFRPIIPFPKCFIIWLYLLQFSTTYHEEISDKHNTTFKSMKWLNFTKKTRYYKNSLKPFYWYQSTLQYTKSSFHI
jgi:hypothetical protein